MSKIPVLFELMEERNISQAQLATDTGISKGNIGDWKSGRSSPSIDKLIILAKYFAVTVDFLLGIEKTSSEIIPEEREKPIIKSSRDYVADMFRKLSNDELLELQNYVGYLMYKRDNPTVD